MRPLCDLPLLRQEGQVDVPLYLVGNDLLHLHQLRYVRMVPGLLVLPDLDLSASFLDGVMVKLRIIISMMQVLSQLGVVYSIPFPDIYSSLLRWMGLLDGCCDCAAMSLTMVTQQGRA